MGARLRMIKRIREKVSDIIADEKIPKIYPKKIYQEHIRGNIWIIIILLAILTAVLGIYGFHDTFQNKDMIYYQEHTTPGISDEIYMAFQLFDLKSGELVTTPPLALDLARFFAIIVAFCTIGFVIFSLFREQVTRFILRYFRNGFVIVCGAGFLGPVIAEYYCDKGFFVVVIEKNEHADETERCREAGAFVITDDASRPGALERVRVDKARYLFAVTGKDAVNASIIADAYQIARNHASKSDLQCYAHIEDINLYPLFRKWEAGLAGKSWFSLDFFNVYHIAGKAAVRENLPLMDPDVPPKILVICVGGMGESIIINAAKKWRDFLIKKRPDTNTRKKIDITLLDINAVETLKRIEIDHPSVEHYADLHPLMMDVTHADFLEAKFLTGSDGSCHFNTIFVCHPDETMATSIGLRLHFELRKRYEQSHTVGSPETTIVIRTTDEYGLTYLITSLRGDMVHWDHLTVFPVLKRTRSKQVETAGLCRVEDSSDKKYTPYGECRLTVIDSLRNDLIITIAESFPDDYVSYYPKSLKKESDPAKELGQNPDRARLMELKREKIRLILSVLRQNGYALTPLVNWEETPEEMVTSLCTLLAREIHKHWRDAFERDRSKEIRDLREIQGEKWQNTWDDLDDLTREKFLGEVRTYPAVFTRCYLKLVGDTREILARRIHENYLKENNGIPARANKPWPELPEELRDSNRAQADNYFSLLKNFGYGIRPISPSFQGPIAFPPEEIEKMAILEHERWMEEKRRSGWSGQRITDEVTHDKKDDRRKIHNCLVSWDLLPQIEKDKDLNTVRNIPWIMAEVGSEVFKEEQRMLS